MFQYKFGGVGPHSHTYTHAYAATDYMQASRPRGQHPAAMVQEAHAGNDPYDMIGFTL
jgi:hypothetical protein